MRVNSVTNNVYGKFGPGPMPTIVEKTEVEPKHKKYYDRQPKVPYVEGETIVKAYDSEDVVEDETVTETTEDESVVEEAGTESSDENIEE